MVLLRLIVRCCYSVAKLCLTLRPHGLQHARLLRLSPRVCSPFMSIQSVMLFNHLILCRPLLLLPSIFPSIRVFSSELALHQVAKVLELQLQHQSFQWIFRIDFLQDGVVGSPCSPRDSQSLYHYHSSRASVLWCSDLFFIQISHLYMTTGKTIALTTRTFFCKVISLLFNILSRFVIAFLPRSKCLLI